MNHEKMPAGSAEQAASLTFITGDKAEGLLITDSRAESLSFVCQGIPVTASLEPVVQNPGYLVVTLKMVPEKPVRFRLDWLIPETALNAALVMNGGLLISPFSDIFPAGGLPVPEPQCGQSNPLSTLRPGQFQTINFSWYPGDTLILYLVMPVD